MKKKFFQEQLLNEINVKVINFFKPIKVVYEMKEKKLMIYIVTEKKIEEEKLNKASKELSTKLKNLFSVQDIEFINLDLKEYEAKKKEDEELEVMYSRSGSYL